MTVSELECGVVYTITAGGTLNGDLVEPRSSYGNVYLFCTLVRTLNSESNSGIFLVIH